MNENDIPHLDAEKARSARRARERIGTKDLTKWAVVSSSPFLTASGMTEVVAFTVTKAQAESFIALLEPIRRHRREWKAVHKDTLGRNTDG